MIQNVLSNIGGIGLYGVISICIFISVFLAAMIWMVCLSRRYVRAMEQLPLEDDASPTAHTVTNLKPNDP